MSHIASFFYLMRGCMNAKKLSIMHSAYFWIILSLLAFALLPSNALDYGLFESTSDEYLEAMGCRYLDCHSKPKQKQSYF